MLPHVRWRTSTFHTISRRLQSSLSQVEVDVASSSSTVPPTPTPTASSPSESETTEAETPFPVQTPLAAKLRRERRKGQGTIFIRPWDGVKSMPEAFAIIRGVERKYGKIRDFMLMRDFDNPDAYQPYFWAEFAEASAFYSVPEGPSVLQIKIPEFDKTQPGGIGLHDLQGLLDAGDKVDETDAEYQSVVARMKAEVTKDDTSSRVVDVRIEQTNRVIYYKVDEEYPNMGRKRILLVGQAFSKWGGFYTPPTEALSGPITEHEVEDQYSPTPNSPLAQVRMQRAQRMWKKLFDESRTPKKPNTEEEDKVDSAVAANVSETTEVGSVEESLGEDSTTSTVSASETSDLATSQPSDPLAPTSEPAPTTTTSTSTSPSEPPTEPFRPAFTQSLTRRQRLLVQARENARTPLPEALIPPTAEELKAKAEAEEKEKAREAAKASSLKTRLLNLIGGKWA